jgi:hypothetical protein
MPHDRKMNKLLYTFMKMTTFSWNSRPVTRKMTFLLCVFRSLLLKNTKKHDICRFSSSQKSKLTTPVLKNGFSNSKRGAYFPLIQEKIVFFCPFGNRGCFQACFSPTPKHQCHWFMSIDVVSSRTKNDTFYGSPPSSPISGMKWRLLMENMRKHEKTRKTLFSTVFRLLRRHFFDLFEHMKKAQVV